MYLPISSQYTWIISDHLAVVGDAGDSQILVDVDQEGLAIGEMLQDLRKMMVSPWFPKMADMISLEFMEFLPTRTWRIMVLAWFIDPAG